MEEDGYFALAQEAQGRYRLASSTCEDYDINCMKINQAYHGLKKHYLINCAGRVCTYSKGTVHCHCQFEKDMTHESGRLYSYNYICKDKNNACLACQNMNKLLKKYLDSKTIEALFKRDKESGF